MRGKYNNTIKVKIWSLIHKPYKETVISKWITSSSITIIINNHINVCETRTKTLNIYKQWKKINIKTKENTSTLTIGKSSFVSHTKHTAEATNMDLFHSWLITCTM